MKKLPVGIEDFKELVDSNFYLVDKTKLILHTLNDKVALYTRPGRFGKTLNMSMIRYFFDLKEKENAYLFDNLAIHNYPEAMIHQNQYPVLFLTLKDMERDNMNSQMFVFSGLIKRSLSPYVEIKDSSKLDDSEKILLNKYLSLEATKDELSSALLSISELLYKHYGKKVIILIDEYDVPLQSAYQKGYYNEMVDFLRNTLSSAFKTNKALEKGIMTGCLRIAKESIFTGLNNFEVHSIFDEAGSDCFGFTVEETRQLLADYNLSDSYDSISKWYDGYLFGSHEIYNPWSLVLSVDDRNNGQPNLVSYWANTSSNVLVYDYIKNGNRLLKSDFEKLVQGKSITKTITPELTYRDMDQIENVYSFLLFTGYLKVRNVVDKENNRYELVIPNKEVNKIFRNQYLKYFGEFKKNKVGVLYRCFSEGKVEEASQLLNELLISSISFFDSYESFFHGFMVGLFSDYYVQSNREAGAGRYDLFIREDEFDRNRIILELKYSKKLNELESDSKKAVEQIQQQKYVEGLIMEGYKNIRGYGISFYGKNCEISGL